MILKRNAIIVNAEELLIKFPTTKAIQKLLRKNNKVTSAIHNSTAINNIIN